MRYISTNNHKNAKQINKNMPIQFVSSQEPQPSGSVQNLNSKTTRIGNEKDSISFKASNVYPLTGKSFNRLRTHPPWGANCLVTDMNGFASNITRKIPGISRNRTYNSHTFPGGISMNPSGWTTTSACGTPFWIEGRRFHALTTLRLFHGLLARAIRLAIFQHRQRVDWRECKVERFRHWRAFRQTS